jgi:hypothetical protein
MPPGQSFTTWFPKLKKLLKDQWEFSLDIQEHFQLVDELNETLTQVRKELNVKPPTFFCKKCNVRHESKMSTVTITSMYFALERLEICTHKEHLELKRNWKKYSKENSINIYGQPIEENKTREHNTVENDNAD